MQHQAEQKLPRSLLYDWSDNIKRNTDVKPEDVCGRGTTVHTYHRMGYDGQEQVLPIEHALIFLSQMLPLPFDCNKDPFTGAKTKSHVQWNGRCLQKDLQS